MTEPTRAQLAARDAEDALSRFRERFALPASVIYLDGNSLGALPRATLGRLARVAGREWGEDLIAGWTTHDWMAMPLRLGDKIARLVGAGAGEVAVCDSTSVNLFKLLSAALSLRPERRVILSQDDNFPTDMYVAQRLVESLGGDHTLRLVPAAEVAGAIDDEVAVAMLSHVDYRSGRLHPMDRITAAAHARGALMLWDLSHSVGAMPIELAGCAADLAVGCGYKYLNGGPGAPAFAYVARPLQDEIRPALAGWMGHRAPFDFDGRYRPAAGIARLLVGTPPVLALAALEVGVDLLLEADLAELRRKSVALTELFIALADARLARYGFELASPRAPGERGSQVCLRHREGYPIVRALAARGVIGDFRPPDILRFGFAPLYIRYVDVWDAVAALAEVMETGAWREPEFRHRAAVT